MKMRKADIDSNSAIAVRDPGAELKRNLDERFKFARHLETPIWIYDVDLKKIVFANQTACRLWQAVDETELYSRDLGIGMSTTVSQRLKQYQSDFVEKGAKFREAWTLYPEGQPISTMVNYSGVRLYDSRMAMQCEVVGETVSVPENVRSTEALLHTDVMISLYENDGAPIYMNPAARKKINSTDQRLKEKFVDQIDFSRLQTNLNSSGEHRMISKMITDSGTRWHDISVKSCLDSVTGKPALLVTEIDVSELKNARDKARYLADSDQLTGCFNRLYLQQHMSMLANIQSERCALLCFDVDRFKQINDCFGHEVGDTVLKEIASRVRNATRRNDVVVRLGGDEFVVVFDDIQDDRVFAETAERLLEIISEPILHDKTRISASVSIGVTIFNPRKADFTELMREADVALYVSKNEGRNRVTFFNEKMGADAKARDAIELELKDSVLNSEFEIYYQPRLDLKVGKALSAEALVRWNHPKRGIVSPAEFIPICEETGLIEELGRMIVKKACDQAIKWRQEGIDLDISVNISPRQFDDPLLMGLLEDISQKTDFPSKRIELEITESALIGSHEVIEEKLKIIAKMGFRIAIDDFGTGYSNLSYISNFPLDCLKIDQSFIAQLPASGPIVGLILTLAGQIGASVVAEGVEDADQLVWLIENGCDQIQGYMVSRPIPAEEFEKLIVSDSYSISKFFDQ